MAWCGCCGVVWLLWRGVAAVVWCGCCGVVWLLWRGVAAVVWCGCCGVVWLLWCGVAAVAWCGCCGVLYLKLLHCFHNSCHGGCTCPGCSLIHWSFLLMFLLKAVLAFLNSSFTVAFIIFSTSTIHTCVRDGSGGAGVAVVVVVVV